MSFKIRQETVDMWHLRRRAVIVIEYGYTREHFSLFPSCFFLGSHFLHQSLIFLIDSLKKVSSEFTLSD